MVMAIYHNWEEFVLMVACNVCMDNSLACASRKFDPCLNSQIQKCSIHMQARMEQGHLTAKFKVCQYYCT